MERNSRSLKEHGWYQVAVKGRRVHFKRKEKSGKVKSGLKSIDLNVEK
ncbi:MAG: hypothetical protein L5655_11395 [Thermosediminibacteraceae bacterium]|nr:hypothetical protein [Thermosediminibacteraceae bacterium]